MRVLFVLRYPPSFASSRVRGLYMARWLDRMGVRTFVLWGYGKLFWTRFLIKSLNADVVYFQKRYWGRDLQAARFVKLLGKKTVFDYDDGLAGGDKGTMRAREAERRGTEMLKGCSCVVAGGHVLLDFARRHNPNSHYVATSVDLDYYRPRATRRADGAPLTLGWIGSGHCYKRDLMMLIRPLERLGRRRNIRLVLVGVQGERVLHNAFGSLSGVEVELVDELQWALPSAAPDAIRDFDVGLYPLLDTAHNRFKCGYKGLEYMAMGVPVVASPVGENRFIVDHGRNGYFAESEKDWEACLDRLCDSADLRASLGTAGRTQVEQDFSTEAWAARLMEILSSLHQQ